MLFPQFFSCEHSGRSLLAAIGVLAAALLLGACGEDGDGGSGGTSELTLSASFRITGGENAVAFLADERGYFADEGLDVEILEGTGSAEVAALVAAGRVDLAFIDGGVVIDLASSEDEAPIRCVAGYFQTSPASVISREGAGIDSLDDLVGRRVGVAGGAAESVLLPAALERNGVDPESVDIVDFDFASRNAAFSSGRVDATAGFTIGDLVIYRDQGIDAAALRFADFGVPIPGACIAARRQLLEDEPDAVRSFLSAFVKAWEETVDDPSAAADAEIALGPEHLQREVEEDSVREAIELFHTDRTEGQPLGVMNEQDWQDGIDFLDEVEDLPRKPEADEVLTNEFLPSG